MFSLKSSMFVNADTLTSLQIVRSELHPNSQVWGPGKCSAGKESLSVYGLFHILASTPQGKARLKQIFLRPSLDVSLILQRQRAITVLLRPENSEAFASIRQCLRNIHNIRPSIAQLRRGADLPTGSHRARIDGGIWATLQKFAAFALKLRDAASRLAGAAGVIVIVKVGCPAKYSSHFRDY